MSNWIPTVKTVTDNVDLVNGATINPILSSLSGRDQYLFERIDSYEDKTIILAYDVPTDGTLAVGDTVYYKPNDNTGSALLKKALATYQNSVDPSHLIPAVSAFVFGIVKQVYDTATATNVADVYVRGLVTDIALNALLDSASLAENKTVGPLYLSSLEAGKLTFNAGGASVFVGYYIDTNILWLAPNIDSLNQLYFNYKVFLQSRYSGTAVNNSGTWSITVSDFTKTGWVDATAAATQYNFTKPTGAKFYYNVPTTAQVLADGTLTADQQKDTLLLKDALPPYPVAFTMLFLNGVLQTMYNTPNHTDGIFLIDGSGIWWFNDQDTYKPWPTASEKVNIILQTVKLNPYYKASVVASLSPYLDGSNDTSKVLQFLDKDTGVPATSGDLVAKFNVAVTTAAQDPVNATFIKDVSYNALLGRIELKTGSGIVAITGGPGIRAVNSNGTVALSLLNFALSGDIEDIEPEESDFVYKGLHSYLRMKNPVANQKVGFVGKFQLPQTLPANTTLKVKLLAFGEGNQPGNNVKFRFEYSISKTGMTINDTIYKGNGGSDILVAGFAQNVSKIVDYNSGTPYFEIPAALLEANAYVNFRIYRVNADYTSNIDVLGVTWAIE